MLQLLQGDTKQMPSLDELEREIKEVRQQFLTESGYTAGPRVLTPRDLQRIDGAIRET